MSLIVQKYGGTSVGSIDRIRGVAERVAAFHREGHRLVVVVSAMAGETNRLLDLGHQISPHPLERETDVLVSSGEQVSAALLSLALNELEVEAVSFLGHQVRISTDSAFGRARIRAIDDERLQETLRSGAVCVVAGFQGIDPNGNITTLGRGGSDTTAVALCAALQGDLCEIYTDVDGVYTADPRIVPGARKMDRISYEEMLELASLGAKVLQIRSVDFAMRYRVPVHVRSSFSEDTGTLVTEEGSPMEDIRITGVAHDSNQAKVTLRRVPDQPGLAARVFGPLAESGIVVDMIIQNASDEGLTDLSFTVSKADSRKALSLVQEHTRELEFQKVVADTNIAKVSLVGVAMQSHSGVAAKTFEVLAEEGINIQMISTSEIKISVIIDEGAAERAVRALHEAFLGTSEHAGARNTA